MMMNFLQELKKQKELIEKKIEFYGNQKLAIETLLSSQGTVEVSIEPSVISKPKPKLKHKHKPKPKTQFQNTDGLPEIGPSSAVLELMQNNPGKWFTTKEIGSYLMEIRNSKTRHLKSSVDNGTLSTIALQTCHSLITQNILNKTKTAEGRYIFALKE